MSGHSKWASIERRKPSSTLAGGTQFTKLARAITVAARDGGGDPVGNAALENAIAKAKAASMPKDNIERAIAKGGTGEGGDSAAIESILYEGYGPGGVALLVEALTDNRNRTGANVRHLLSKYGGSLGEPARSRICSTSAASSRSTARATARTITSWSRSRRAPSTSSPRRRTV